MWPVLVIRRGGQEINVLSVGRTSGCFGVLETWGVCSPTPPACLLPSSSLSRVHLPDPARSDVGIRGGSVHLLPMCPCVLPQRFQKDDQQDKMNWGGAGWGVSVSARRAAHGGSPSHAPPPRHTPHIASWDSR